MKIVLDSNVLVAGFATPGVCHEILEQCLMEHDLVISEFILSEVERALIGRLKMPPVEAHKNIVFLKKTCLLVSPATVNAPALRDSNDLPILGTAAAAQAKVIVSGDKDLLILGTYEGILVLSPREFISKLG